MGSLSIILRHVDAQGVPQQQVRNTLRKHKLAIRQVSFIQKYTFYHIIFNNIEYILAYTIYDFTHRAPGPPVIPSGIYKTIHMDVSVGASLIFEFHCVSTEV